MYILSGLNSGISFLPELGILIGSSSSIRVGARSTKNKLVSSARDLALAIKQGFVVPAQRQKKFHLVPATFASLQNAHRDRVERRQRYHIPVQIRRRVFLVREHYVVFFVQRFHLVADVTLRHQEPFVGFAVLNDVVAPKTEALHDTSHVRIKNNKYLLDSGPRKMNDAPLEVDLINS
jgi:hypothetical protein